MIKSGTTKNLKLFNMKEGRNDNINSIQNYPSNDDENLFKSNRSVSNLFEGDLSLLPNVETPIKEKPGKQQNKIMNKLSSNLIFEKKIHQIDLKGIIDSPKERKMVNQNTNNLQSKLGNNNKFITSGYNTSRHSNSKDKNILFSKFIKVSTPRSKIILNQLNSPKADFQSQTMKYEASKNAFSIKVISPHFNISDPIKAYPNEKEINKNEALDKDNALTNNIIKNNLTEEIKTENFESLSNIPDNIFKEQKDSESKIKSNSINESNDIT